MSDTLIRPRILLVTRNLPPLVGGMERLNWHMAAELARGAEVRVIGPKGAAALAPEGVVVREVPLKPLWRFLLRARALARKEAWHWRPDIVLAGSGLTAPIARSAARACGARTAVYVHGLDVAVKHPVYRALWLPAIRNCDRVIANSRATADLCRGIGVDSKRVGIVHPGVDMPRGETHFSRAAGESKESGVVEAISPRERGTREGPASHNDEHRAAPEPSSGPSGHLLPEGEGQRGEPVLPADSGAVNPLSLRERGRGEGPESRNSTDSMQLPASSSRTPRSGDQGPSDSSGTIIDRESFRQRHNLGSRPLLLSIGRLSARKGLREFVTQALPVIAAAHPDVLLLIVGDAPKDALNNAAQTADSIRAAAAQVGVSNNLWFLGAIGDEELEAAYRAASVHVFPVREIPGDPEGFGMVAVEAAAHGLPTVAFATGGVVDAVSEGQSGFLVMPDEYAALADAVLRVITMRHSMPETCRAFARQFAWPAFGEQVVAQLARVVPRLVASGETT